MPRLMAAVGYIATTTRKGMYGTLFFLKLFPLVTVFNRLCGILNHIDQIPSTDRCAQTARKLICRSTN